MANKKLVVEYYSSFANGADKNSKKEEYKVVKIVDSVDYHPGEILSKDAVSGLCRNAAWTVTVLPRSE